MTSIHIYDIDCPACGIRCWVNNGDVDDLTVSDVQAVRCWHCHHEFRTDDTSEIPLEDLLIDETYQSKAEALR